MNRDKFIKLFLSIFTVIFLDSCGTTSTTTTTTGGIYTAHLIDSTVSGVQYACIKNDNTIVVSGITNATGDFKYSQDCSVKFYLGRITLALTPGSKVYNLSDQDLYITDAVGVSRDDTHNQQVVNILRVLQSLDADDNPENGIDINSTVRDNLAKTTVNPLSLSIDGLTQSDLNKTIEDANISKTLITTTKAIAHFETVLRDDAQIQIDTVPPAKPVVLTVDTDPIIVPSATDSDPTPIKIIGEKGSKIFINNILVDTISKTTGYTIVDLNTTGSSISNFNFDIMLQDDKDHNSTINHINIFKDLVSPTVPNNNINISINEQQNFVQNIDANDSSALTYGIMKSSDNNKSVDWNLFQIDNSGNVTFIEDPDYDQNYGRVYSVVVYAKDAAQHVTAVYLQVNIINILDNPPALTATTFTANPIMEQTPNATIIFDANDTLKSIANAPDNKFSYHFSLVNGTDLFDINSSTGQISIKDNTQPLFDYEQAPNSFDLQFRVTNDNNTSKGNTTDATIKINILNHIDTTPKLDIPNSLDLNEKSISGTTVTTITKSASGNDANKTMTFSIVAGNDGNFTIDPSSGVISVATSNLDFETKPNYTLTIEATNTWYDNTTHSDDVNLTINLIDQIDNPPVLKDINSTFSFPENSAKGTYITTMILDGTNNDENTTTGYRIDTTNSSVGYNQFAIDSSGRLTINTDSLNYNETDSNDSITSYRLAIQAIDKDYTNATLYSNTIYVDINITNVIDNIPKITIANNNISLDENLTINSVVATVIKNGTIWDENQTSSFSFDYSGDKFDINSSTGEITLKNNLDWESNVREYNFNITATNIAGSSDPLPIHITVNNVLEEPPLITLEDNSLDIHENTPVGSLISFIKEPINTDINNSADDTVIDSFSIKSGNDGNFSIKTIDNKGYISILHPLDYETTNHYDLKIVGTNGYGDSIEQNLTINILNDVEKDIPLLAITIEYNDMNLTTSLTDIQNLTTLFSDSGVSELNKYFQTISGGLFNFKAANESYDTNPATDGIVMVRLNRDHPQDNPTQLKDDISDALTISDDNVTYSDFDTNGDGNISNTELQLLFIVAGGERTYGDDNQSILAFTSSFDDNITLDGVNVAYKTGKGNYVAVGERNGVHMATLGLIAKFLAKTTFDFSDDTDIGTFGLMDDGYKGHDANESLGETPIYPSAYNRLSQGWLYPRTLKDSGYYNINFDTSNVRHTLDTHTHIVKIPTSDTNIYYLIENRNNNDQTDPKPYDNGLYFINDNNFSGGLKIWEIDTTNTPIDISNVDINNSDDNIFRPTNATGDLSSTSNDFSFDNVGTIDSADKTYSITIKK
jgi:hypothetical protein